MTKLILAFLLILSGTFIGQRYTSAPVEITVRAPRIPLEPDGSYMLYATNGRAIRWESVHSPFADTEINCVIATESGTSGWKTATPAGDGR